jgi:hypothetical protein
VGHVRFQLDEHLPHAIARSVRRLGIGVSTAEEAGTVGMSDGGLLAYCLAEGRVLVTNDNDFPAAKEPRTVLIDPESELGRGLNENNGGPVMLLCGGTGFRACALTRTGRHAGAALLVSVHLWQ